LQTILALWVREAARNADQYFAIPYRVKLQGFGQHGLDRDFGGGSWDDRSLDNRAAKKPVERSP
jgi:hypothetical protein